MKTKENIFIIIFISFSSLIVSPIYSQTDTLKCSDSIANFIENHWERKSKKLIEDFESKHFEKIKPCLIGKSRQEILELFGNASLNNLMGLTYYIDKKPNKNKDSRSIFFAFNIDEICTSCYLFVTLPTIY